MTAWLKKIAEDARQRAMMAVGRCVLSAIDDTTKCQSLQVDLLDGETGEDIEHFQTYGFTSVPFEGAEGVMASVGGLRSHGIVIAITDRRYRPTGMQSGEGGMYDDQAQTILIKRDGIYITTTKKVTVNAAEVDVTADHVNITSDDINLGGEGGNAVARVGDPISTGGVIESGSTKVKAA